MICRFCLISRKDFQKLVIMYHLGNYTKLLYYIYKYLGLCLLQEITVNYQISVQLNLSFCDPHT